MANMMFTLSASNNQIELPEFFLHYLQEYHGIDLNATPRTFKDAWLKYRYTRDFTFNQVNRWYGMIKARLKEVQKTLNNENYDLNTRWGTSIEVPIDLSLLHSNDWRNPTTAVSTLKRVYEQLPTREQILEMSAEVDRHARETWVRELLDTARQKNATLVVLKTGYKPYDFNAQKFNDAVARREPCVIRMMCIGLEWLCCSVEKLSEMLLEDIGRNGLNQNNCTVDYIVD